MILLIHILLALVSIVLTTYTAVYPSKDVFRKNYVMTGATLTSGILLVISQPVDIPKTCVSGLIYLIYIGFALKIATRRLSTVN